MSLFDNDDIPDNVQNPESLGDVWKSESDRRQKEPRLINYEKIVGQNVYLEQGKPYRIESVGKISEDVSVLDTSLTYPILRAMSKSEFERFAYNSMNSHLLEPDGQTISRVDESIAKAPLPSLSTILNDAAHFREEQTAQDARAQKSVNYTDIVGKTFYWEDNKPHVIKEAEMYANLIEFSPMDTSSFIAQRTTFVIPREDFEHFVKNNPMNSHLLAEGNVQGNETVFSELEGIFREGRESESYKKLKDSNFDERIDAILDGDFELLEELERKNEEREAREKREKLLNFHISDDNLGIGGAVAKYNNNVAAIKLLKQLETENRLASAEEQETLSRYVGWGGLPQAFDHAKGDWQERYEELKSLLSNEEYESARASTLNAHYTSPTVIKAIYETVEKMGFSKGNILEPSMGVGNFFGLLPESMKQSKLYGVELDDITVRIAKQLYQGANITVSGFENTSFPDNFFDVAIGNVPFGDYKVPDSRYDKHNFRIHDYFFAKTLDQVRPGGIVAFITSKGTLDKQNTAVRKYLAQRAELLGAIRLPNNAFKANAGTEVTSDIIFLQKRERQIEVEPDWVTLENIANDENYDKNDNPDFPISVNNYFIRNPQMILGKMVREHTQYGGDDVTCIPLENSSLSEQLRKAMSHIQGKITEPEINENEKNINNSIPADLSVKNFSFALIEGQLYYRENSVMVKPAMKSNMLERAKELVKLRDCVKQLIKYQVEGFSDEDIFSKQEELNALYDRFSSRHGLVNDKENAKAFDKDSSYYLLCSLEVLDKDNNFERKADMFTKRTIKQKNTVSVVETPTEALAVSLAEKACVDLEYMSQLARTSQDRILYSVVNRHKIVLK